MDKFYYKAKEDVIGTRICIGDTVVIDVESDPQNGDIVLVSVASKLDTALMMYGVADADKIKILGRVVEQIIFM